MANNGSECNLDSSSIASWLLAIYATRFCASWCLIQMWAKQPFEVVCWKHFGRKVCNTLVLPKRSCLVNFPKIKYNILEAVCCCVIMDRQPLVRHSYTVMVLLAGFGCLVAGSVTQSKQTDSIVISDSVKGSTDDQPGSLETNTTSNVYHLSKNTS